MSVTKIITTTPAPAPVPGLIERNVSLIRYTLAGPPVAVQADAVEPGMYEGAIKTADRLAEQNGKAHADLDKVLGLDTKYHIIPERVSLVVAEVIRLRHDEKAKSEALLVQKERITKAVDRLAAVLGHRGNVDELVAELLDQRAVKEGSITTIKELRAHNAHHDWAIVFDATRPEGYIVVSLRGSMVSFYSTWESSTPSPIYREDTSAPVRVMLLGQEIGGWTNAVTREKVARFRPPRPPVAPGATTTLKELRERNVKDMWAVVLDATQPEVFFVADMRDAFATYGLWDAAAPVPSVRKLQADDPIKLVRAGPEVGNWPFSVVRRTLGSHRPIVTPTPEPIPDEFKLLPGYVVVETDGYVVLVNCREVVGRISRRYDKIHEIWDRPAHEPGAALIWRRPGTKPSEYSSTFRKENT